MDLPESAKTAARQIFTLPHVYGLNGTLESAVASKLDNMLSLISVTRGTKQKKLFLRLADFCGLVVKKKTGSKEMVGVDVTTKDPHTYVVSK